MTAETLSFLDVNGKRKDLSLSGEQMELYGLEFNSRVSTPQGLGSVMGETHHRIYVLLDIHKDAQTVSAMTMADLTVLTEPESPEDRVDHRIKHIAYRGRQVRVATQQRNGPCPVLALANALALQGKIAISPANDRHVTAVELRRTLADFLSTDPAPASFGAAASSSPCSSASPAAAATASSTTPAIAGPRTMVEVATSSPEEWAALREELLGCHDDTAAARASHIDGLLKRLYTGMLVDPVLASVEGFAMDEKDVALFPLAGVRLLHGWVIAADSPFGALRHFSYNSLSAIAVTSPSPGSPETDEKQQKNDEGGTSGFNQPAGANEEDEEGGSGHRGSNTTATLAGMSANELRALAHCFCGSAQNGPLTREGRAQLLETIAEDEVVVLFWNNHFFTATVIGGRLMLLCSDENFSDKTSFVFSLVSEDCREDGYVDGDGEEINAVVAGVQAHHGTRFTEDAILLQAAMLRSSALGEGVDDSTFITLVMSALETQGQEQQQRAQAAATAATSSSPSLPSPAQTTPTSAPEAAVAERTAVARAQSAPGSAPPRLVQQFREVFPDVSADLAADYLRCHGDDLEAAVSAFASSL